MKSVDTLIYFLLFKSNAPSLSHKCNNYTLRKKLKTLVLEEFLENNLRMAAYFLFGSQLVLPQLKGPRSRVGWVGCSPPTFWQQMALSLLAKF